MWTKFTSITFERNQEKGIAELKHERKTEDQMQSYNGGGEARSIGWGGFDISKYFFWLNYNNFLECSK